MGIGVFVKGGFHDRALRVFGGHICGKLRVKLGLPNIGEEIVSASMRSNPMPNAKPSFRRFVSSGTSLTLSIESWKSLPI